MYSRLGLILMVTHACNLRCTYCYTGQKFSRAMPREFGIWAIERAVASLEKGGVLELSFFGGEPLMEAAAIQQCIDYAQQSTRTAGIQLRFGLTTNGTVAQGTAWDILTDPQLDLLISHDGLAEIHDRHRLHVSGQPSSHQVIHTMHRLRKAGKFFRVNVVVRPDSVEQLLQSVIYLQKQGATHLNLSLDLWANWQENDLQNLLRVIAPLAEHWRAGLPNFGINWFDGRAAQLAGMTLPAMARCGFGAGEIAVAPSGRLYPCERLIGEDDPDHPLRLSGHVMDGMDFLNIKPMNRDAISPTDPHEKTHVPCQSCNVAAACDTFCRCSNFVRTGDVTRPDRLLCLWNQQCLVQTARVLPRMVNVTVEKNRQQQEIMP